MAKKEIVQKDSYMLRQKAAPIPVKEILSTRIQKIIKNMTDTLSAEEDGVALAAPQIAEPLSIFIVSGKVFDEHDSDKIFINPELTKTSRKKENMHEGCLSVRGLYGNVKRHTKATVKAYDQDGNTFTLGASGLLAQIFQHEMDHLNGVLFTDKATTIKTAEELNHEQTS